MKVGSESRTKLYIAIGLFCVALFFVYRWISGSSEPASAQTPQPAVAAPAAQTPAPAAAQRRPGGRKGTPAVITSSIDPTLRTDLLKASEDSKYEGKGRNIFRAEAEPPVPIPQPFKDPRKEPQLPPPGPPPPPPINLKFYGFANRNGEAKSIFLSQGDDIFVAREGDIVKSRYKVLRISPNAVEIEDLLSNNRQSIPLTQS